MVAAVLGMIAVFAGAVVVGAAVARHGFRRRIDRLQQSLQQAPAAPGARAGLPAEVLALAQWLGAADGRPARLVRLTQRGEMWLKPGARALAFTARQTIAVADVGFLWQAKFAMAGLPMRIIDYLVDDQGGLQGRLVGVVPVVTMIGGDAMFRGEAMRYLAELIWAPDAMLLNRRLDWRVIDARTLAVATGAGARRCEVRLLLDEAGDPVRVEADDRPRQDRGVVTPTPWFCRGRDFRAIGGRRIPTAGEAGWIVDGVEFIYWRARIESWASEA
ncbi:MAG: DUF6544 family protein [Xanthobacteraceae bacterium]|jgi:hypothetical protein